MSSYKQQIAQLNAKITKKDNELIAIVARITELRTKLRAEIAKKKEQEDEEDKELTENVIQRIGQQIVVAKKDLNNIKNRIDQLNAEIEGVEKEKADSKVKSKKEEQIVIVDEPEPEPKKEPKKKVVEEEEPEETGGVLFADRGWFN